MPICEMCGNENFTLIATKIREGKGRIVKCESCGLVMQDADWNRKQLKKYYEEKYQRTNPLVTGKVQTPLEHFNERLKTIGAIFEQIRPLLRAESRILEVGSGPGALLSLIKPHVSRCVGVDIHSPFVSFMKNRLSIVAYAEDINALNLNDKFDLIISIATLDHLPNPFETLLSMKKLLAPSGKIYIEVPNRDEALNHFIPYPNRKKFNEFFWHMAHLFYFTKDTIQALFKKAGLKIKLTCRHDYTLKNFLHWYFVGNPQPSLVVGHKDIQYFEGKSEFEVRMSKMFEHMENEFKKIMAETFLGDNLCCLGWV